GNEQNLFDRFDFKPSEKNTVNLNFQFTRSWYQTPNSYDAQNATAWTGLVVDNGGYGPNGALVGPADQHAQIKTLNIAPTWTRLMNNNTVLTLGGYVRRDQFNYYPSANPFADFTPDLQGQSIGQNRKLTNTGAHAAVSYVKGVHNLKVGANFSHTLLAENDSFGIVDPTFNPVCFNADGSPNTDPTLTNPTNCSGPLQVNSSFDPLLACYDLTRTGTLPASDGCPKTTSGLYTYGGHSDIKELALFAQDTITFKNWVFNLGLRGDIYNGISIYREAEPRVGVAYNIKPTNTVLRVSYARILETPFNENLILASTGCNDAVVNDLMATIQGYPCLTVPLTPGTRNEFHAGLEQAFSKYLVVDGEYIWKYTHRAYDFSILGATPITYPIEWDHSKIPGYAVRATVPNAHGFTAFVVFSSVAARFFEPQASGIGATPAGQGGNGVFRIDHDEVFNSTAHLQYQPFKRGPWVGVNWRYDSGLVAGPVPCAGGNCANGPNGTNSVVDFSNLTPDQQFQAGLSCGGVFATPTTPISSSGLCPASQYSSSLVKIPAAGTENDDHNPPRIAPRNLFDVAVGEDNLFNGDKYKWSLRVSVINLTNKEALYNFLSTFSGTHYVTPRAITAELAFHF
ncbi:MAG: TonB-dependent receptor, partial [Acidobacteriota bacterium]|nr:TonB-dependent receptor [Acidobacteriota bacterium]